MKKFTKGLAALLLSATMLAGCDIIDKDKKEEEEQHEDVPTVVAVTGVSLGSNSLQLYVGFDTTLSAVVAPENATNKAVSWSVDHPEVVSVVNGKVTGLAVGTAVVTVTTEDGNKTAQCTVEVTEKPADVVPVESITISEKSIELDVGGSKDLSATVLPENATNKNFSWSTSEASVATVVDGHVVAVAPGTATITVTTEQGGKQDTCTVRVNSTEHPQAVKSGAYVELDGTGYSFVTGKDGEIVHLEEASGKTKVWGIVGGVVTLGKAGHTYPVTVTYDVAQISVGSTYANYAARTGEYTLVSNPDKFTVGNKNNFYPHFELLCNSYLDDGSGWGEDEVTVDLLNAGTYFDNNDKPQLIVASEYADVNADYSLKFKDAAIGQDVLVSLKYKTNTINMTVAVKEGYNAHNHEELKALVEDTKIGGQVNVLRNIKAELSRDRFFEDPQQPAAPDGTHMYPMNIYEGNHTKTMTGSVYNRVFYSSEENNPISINGNFLEIDARSVPDHVPSTQSGQRVPSTYGSIALPNNGEGIFYVGTTTDHSEPDFTLNNVKVTGNSRVGTVEEPDAGAYGLAAVVANHAAIVFNNSKIEHVERGTFNISKSSTTANNTAVTDAWGPGLMGWGAKSLSMNHCLSERLGGPIFWAIDNREDEGFQTSVSWDKTSILNNWMLADSSWCQVNGMTSLGQGIDMIEDIIKNINFSVKEGITFNFVYLAMVTDRDYPVSLYNNVSINDETGNKLYSATESPDDLKKLPEEHPVRQIMYSANGNYICGVGQSWDDMMNGVVQAMIGGADAQTAYVTTLGNFMATQLATIGHSYLNVSYDLTGKIPGVSGFCTAFCEALRKVQ